MLLCHADDDGDHRHMPNGKKKGGRSRLEVQGKGRNRTAPGRGYGISWFFKTYHRGRTNPGGERCALARSTRSTAPPVWRIFGLQPARLRGKTCGSSRAVATSGGENSMTARRQGIEAPQPNVAASAAFVVVVSSRSPFRDVVALADRRI